MKTVGELLQSARLKKNLTTLQISHLTKIQEKFIKALETGDYKQLPESAFVKGFIRNYAQVVNKKPQELLAIFRRDYSQDLKGKVIPRSLTKPLSQPLLRWTPRTTAITAFVTTITIFLAYLILQFRLLSGVPKLTVIKPQENDLVSSLVNVEGSTNPLATITVNSKRITLKEDGSFTETISLSPGVHTITIKALSRSNKTTTIQRTVTVE